VSKEQGQQHFPPNWQKIALIVSPTALGTNDQGEFTPYDLCVWSGISRSRKCPRRGGPRRWRERQQLGRKPPYRPPWR